MTRIIIAALFALLVSGPVWAEKDVDVWSGIYWYKNCSNPNDTDILLCLGFITGLVDGQAFLENLYVKRNGTFTKFAPYCVPDGVDIGQRKDIFVKFLRDHPEKRQGRASVLFAQATRKAFCK